MGAVASETRAHDVPRRSLPIVHVADPLAEDGLVLLRERCEVRTTTGLSEADLASRLADVDALIVRSETKVTARILDAAPRLAVVGRAGVGVDNIDVPAATARGVYVVNAPLGNIVAAAEHTIALALALLRNIPEADRSVRAGEWKRAKLMGRELRGKTLGLVGIGRVGSEVARRAAAFEMKVIAHDPFATEASARAAGAQLVELDELYSRADVISLHTPLTEKTRGMVNADEIGGAQQLVELHQLGTRRARTRLCRERVVRDDLHLEPGRAARDFRSDAADPDEAQGLAAQLAANEFRTGPLARADAAVRIGDAPEQRQREGERVLRSGNDVPERRVHDVDAASGRRRNVDVVHADPGAPDDGQPRRRIEDLRRHLGLAADDERVDIGEARGEVGLGEPGRGADLAPFAQQDKAVLGERIGHVNDGAAQVGRRGFSLCDGLV